MSIQALAAVLDHSKARLSTRLVLIAIANHADEKGRNSYPNLETLAHEARVSVRQVQRAVDQLVEMGELVAKNRFKTSNLYQIVLPTLVDNQPRQIVRSDKSAQDVTTTVLNKEIYISNGYSDKSARYVMCEECGCAVLDRDLIDHKSAHEVAS